MEQVPVFKPLLEQEEIDACTEALKMGWLGMGSYVSKFEEALSDFLGLEGKYLACVNTGHSALHLACVLAGVGHGDEVITPSFNCVSDFQAIITCGGEPVLCDVRDDTLCIDVDSAEEMVTEKTKAVVIMDYATSQCDHDRVKAFAAKHNLRVIHDAAHTFGSSYKGRKVGSFSDMTMLSFDPVKTVTALDAGALIVSSEEELRRIHELRILGMGQPPSVMYQNKRAWTFHVNDIGFRYHLLNIHGAMGLSQLAKIDRIASTRRATCRYYNDHFAEIGDIRTPSIDFENVVPFIYYLRVPADARDDFRTFLGERGVDTGVHWQPGHHFKLLDNCRRSDLSVSDRAGNEIVTLPLHSDMALDHMEAVVDAVKDFFAGAKPKSQGSRSAAEQMPLAG
jgi:dTDP-4-amino-4,6-dideoxygalactose transaminase